jgi:hypothetical protein
MQHTRGLAAYVYRHVAVEGRNSIEEIAVVYYDGTEVRGIAAYAAPNALIVKDVSSGRAVSIHTARVERAEVFHRDGWSERFE